MFVILRDIDRDLDDMGGLFCFALLVGVILTVGMLATLTRVLGRVRPELRRMEPGEVWVNLIPFVNVMWAVVTVERVGESVRNELKARGLAKKRDGYGKTSGLIALVLLSLVVLVHPLVGVVTVPFAFLYGIVYWFQMNEYARRMLDAPPEPEPEDEGW